MVFDFAVIASKAELNLGMSDVSDCIALVEDLVYSVAKSTGISTSINSPLGDV